MCYSYEAQQISGAHRICHVVSKNGKLVWWKLGQTAHKLETNARANFPIAENLIYQCMENGEEKHAHVDIFVAHCGFQAQY